MDKILIPMETGMSMAPWLKPGDVVLVDRKVKFETLRLGDVIVLQQPNDARAIVHRIIRFERGSKKFPFATKGDRFPNEDHMDDSFEFIGKVLERQRNGTWTKIRMRRFFWFLSRFGLYPGQFFPQWMSRTEILKRLGG